MRQQVDAAARTLQPLIRGLLARRLARREKALLGQASHGHAGARAGAGVDADDDDYG